jgi:prepilin-type N-terminal cleavage/methylation domain-containing protein
MNYAHRINRQAGYTLVEIAMVLAVIGLILGGVALGKDVMREADYDRIQNKFLMPWKQAYDLYYQRTGVVLGDSQIAPTLMVDGQEANINNADGHLAGIPSNYSNTGRRISHGQGYPPNTVGVGDPPLSNQDMHALFDRIGIRMPAGRGEGYEDRYVYEDSNGNPVELQIAFQWNPDKTISGAGNVMVIRGLTPDLARKLDQMIDGKPDALEGRFRQQNAMQNSTETSSQRPGYEWQANDTFAEDGLAPSATATGEDKDENRVVLLTAHWIMDQ